MIIKTQVICVIFIIIFDSITVYFNYGIDVIAYGTSFGYFIYGFTCTGIAFNSVKNNNKFLIKMFICKILPIVVVMVNYVVFNYYFAQSSFIISSFGYTLQFFIMVVLLWIVNRDKIMIELLNNNFKIFNKKLNL